MDEIKVPIYLMTGFLESGKTSFLSFTIQQDYFHTDGKTLLILCEEGEEEYDPAILEANNTVVEVIENEEDFTTDRLVAMDILHQPERVIIEYNGMWLVSNFEKTQLPTGWGVEQQITCVDGSTFQMYMANMKSIFMDMIKNTDMVIFNRCKKEDPLPTYRRGIKVANQRAEVIFEDEEGELGDIFQDEMPFDMNAPVIEILPEDYGIWFVDAMDHPENYEGKTVKFKDLGLLIVDEEQRFGVAQKEKIKEKFPRVDVLTLSATPIPRTLNMAMSGIRDMSLIEEAPGERHPVQTYVIEYDAEVLQEAMEREINRGGQCYYLHNNVETIEHKAMMIKKAIPQARVGIAHGQMGEEELSSVWHDLLSGDIDILVCTTIIETGVDVPNCNTLIMENADRMGLAQLHQIRGRVGRSSRRAYAYFTFTRGKELTDIATRRLEAIREYTEFGSGFKIAMRDLEIRGAGSLLGNRQHGHMEAVGYDMYLKLLEEAVAMEKGEISEDEPEERECLIDVQIDAHLPEEYIISTSQRLSMYKRIAGIKNEADAQDVYDELTDRFGAPPASVWGLIEIALLRNSAKSLGITDIVQRNGAILFYSSEPDIKTVAILNAFMKGRVTLSAAKRPYIAVKLEPTEATLETIRETLKIMSEAKEHYGKTE